MDEHRRMVADCRRVPSIRNCTLTIAGTEEEVVKVALRHAIEDHGHEDTTELKEQIRSSLEVASAGE